MCIIKCQLKTQKKSISQKKLPLGPRTQHWLAEWIESQSGRGPETRGTLTRLTASQWSMRRWAVFRSPKMITWLKNTRWGCQVGIQERGAVVLNHIFFPKPKGSDRPPSTLRLANSYLRCSYLPLSPCHNLNSSTADQPNSVLQRWQCCLTWAPQSCLPNAIFVVLQNSTQVTLPLGSTPWLH